MNTSEQRRGLGLRLAGSFAGSGLSPVMPGTVGTLAASGAMLAVELAFAPPWWWMPLAAIVVFALGTLLATASIRRFGKDDPQWFVLDEVAGVLLACTGLGVLSDAPLLLVLGVGFFCFRVFDILKPWPIRRLEHVGEGFGVMIDDIVAGALAWPCAYGGLMLFALAGVSK
ncbi:MAG: phosphatidylglycerophosphatase A [Planctomycetes bacterium]|nr:phosphatidylglycerophosphatase A [Planctomycetota bacterium]